MRTNIVLYWLLAAFFALAAVVYITWNLLARDTVEWVGSIGLLFAFAMGGMWAFYLQRALSAQGGVIAEDREDADIDDGDPEIGEFPAYSWWPISLAAAISVSVIGLAVGSWIISVIAAPFFIVFLIGWVFEFYRGNHAR